LIEIGRRKIAYLGLDEDDKADHDKLRGYRAALARAGIPFDPRRVRRVPRTFRGGYDAMASIVAEQIEVDGVFAFNDLMAIGAMRYAATHGVAVPDELAIVGFGGSELASMVTPALSTIVVPLYTIGVTAFQELLDLIRVGGQERRHVHSEPELAIRGSSVATAELLE
jgi:DNA-binding LacI/PurR family transcriptional regulator